jgi:hypothetical protein
MVISEAYFLSLRKDFKLNSAFSNSNFVQCVKKNYNLKVLCIFSNAI